MILFLKMGVGIWRAVIEQTLSSNICNRILAILPPSPGLDDDRIAWASSNDGSFSMKMAYLQVSGVANGSSIPLYAAVWKWDGPEQTRAFLWKVATDVLMTNVQRHRRGMTLDATCPLCGALEKTTLHSLRDCPEQRSMWDYFLPSSRARAFFASDSDREDWIQQNICAHDDQSLEWSRLFGIVMEQLWQRRNEKVFKNILCSLNEVITYARNMIQYLRMAANHRGLVRPLGPSHWFYRQVRWQPPLEGWAKINTDGAFSATTTTAACGGVFRND